MKARLVLRHATATHPGLVRPNNEDCAYASDRLVALADGVGGEVAGEVASALAIEALKAAERAADPVAGLRAALTDANARIAAATADDPALAGMGTTATAILCNGRRAALGHVGDSRAYRLRAGTLDQLTRDDTYVQQLVEEGRITAEQARVHPQRSMVTNVLQGVPAELTVTGFGPDPGDRYLLCSDGLPDAVPDADIAGALRANPDPAACADQLISLALAAGGPDNVTVIVADVASTGRRWLRRMST